jgi:hypothetical protein
MTAAVAENHNAAQGRLETDLKSMTVANLHRLGIARRASDDAVSLRPFNAGRLFEREARLRDLEAKEIEGRDRPDQVMGEQ